MSDVESGHKGDLQGVVDSKNGQLFSNSDYDEAANAQGEDDIARIEKVYRYASIHATQSFSI